MARIRKIEIVCAPCHKCEVLQERLKTVIRCLEFKYSMRIRYQFVYPQNKKEFIAALKKYEYTAKEVPITLINDVVAFVGHVKGDNVIRWKLEDIMKTDKEVI